eukprot:GHVR01086568.1.p1 GENE.GHVR01086568.1~~GHVR01086568.1.p1  ORF type:complete len:113 (+),score=1.30 GHVR01086568.1:389-727(+)
MSIPYSTDFFDNTSLFMLIDFRKRINILRLINKSLPIDQRRHITDNSILIVQYNTWMQLIIFERCNIKLIILLLRILFTEGVFRRNLLNKAYSSIVNDASDDISLFEFETKD